MNAVSLRREGYVDIITLQRPPINALDMETLSGLSEAVESAKTDPESRVLLIASSLDGIFCAGGDLKFWMGIADGRDVGNAGRRVLAQIESFPKPTIAVLNGHVIGDGLSLALVCDLRVASETVSFRMPEASYGFIPGWGSVKRLIAAAGLANASEMLLTGKQITADRARLIGLVNETVPSEALMNFSMETAIRIAGFSPASLRAIKCALRGGDESLCFESVWGKEDWKEGISALMQKRGPKFSSSKQITECCSFSGNRFQPK